MRLVALKSSGGILEIMKNCKQYMTVTMVKKDLHSYGYRWGQIEISIGLNLTTINGQAGDAMPGPD